MLTYQHTVSHCIVHFVALEVIMDVSNMYFEALKGNLLKEVLHHSPEVVKCGSTIVFRERTCFHKCARVLYKVLRCLYVSVIFYFIPFSVLFL
jgi:predicted nucleic acid-binding Zn ribbon protein